jgi:hypothetical protein
VVFSLDCGAGARIVGMRSNGTAFAATKSPKRLCGSLHQIPYQSFCSHETLVLPDVGSCLSCP